MTENGHRRLVLTAAAAFFAACLACFLLNLAGFVRFVLPELQFPYDLIALDGDHLNYAARVMKGLPLYLDYTKGLVLCVCTPLYHYILALLAGFFGLDMRLARALSLFFFAGTLLAAGLAVRARAKEVGGAWAAALTAAGALCLLGICDPEAPWWYVQSRASGLLARIIEVGPNSAYVMFGAFCLYLYDRWEREGKGRLLAASAALGALSLLSKQHGIFAPAGAALCLAVNRERVRDMGLFASSFAAVFVPAALYLELSNGGNFLNCTFLRLGSLMPNDPGLMAARLWGFVKWNSPWLLLALAGAGASLRRGRLSAWHCGAAVSLALAAATLGNPACGPNYYFPLWLCVAVSAWSLISELARERSARPAAFAAALAAAAAASALSAGFYAANFSEKRVDPAASAPLMERYYAEIGRLLSSSPDKKVLASRIEGAFVIAGAEIDYEFSTLMFAWDSGSRYFSREPLLERIRRREFSFITVGRRFPADALAVIMENYRPLEKLRVYTSHGREPQDVWVLVPGKARPREWAGLPGRQVFASTASSTR